MNTSKRMFKSVLAVAVAAGFQLAVPTADAAPCAGFSDVDDANPDHAPFCPSVEWIKNRGVTTGCGDGTIYCPTANVGRLTMAAFMKSLGDKLSPASFSLEANPGAINLDPIPTPRICVTPGATGTPAVLDIAPAAYPRRAFIKTTFSGLTGGALQYRTDLQFSSNQGASWDFVWLNYVNRDGASAAHWVSSSASGTLDLEANLPYRFSMLISRQAGGGTADFNDSRCFVTVAVYSRTSLTTPFDPNPAKAPDADH